MYDDNGNYFFNPDVDSDDAEALAQVDRIEHARAYRRQQQQGYAYGETVNKSTQDALEELGISQSEWQQMVTNTPFEEQQKAIARGTQKYVRKVAKAHGTKQSKQKPEPKDPDLLGSREAPRRSNADLSEYHAKVERDGYLSADDEIEVIKKLLS